MFLKFSFSVFVSLKKLSCLFFFFLIAFSYQWHLKNPMDWGAWRATAQRVRHNLMTKQPRHLIVQMFYRVVCVLYVYLDVIHKTFKQKYFSSPKKSFPLPWESCHPHWKHVSWIYPRLSSPPLRNSSCSRSGYWPPCCWSVLVAQWWPTLCNPIDCTPPGSSVHGILQARILERVATPFSRRSSWSRDRTQVLLLAKILTFSAHRSRKKNTETQFGESRKVAFILSQQRGEASRLLPQELCPLHEESRGFYRARACSQVMRNKGDRILIASSCRVSKTIINGHQ